MLRPFLGVDCSAKLHRSLAAYVEVTITLKGYRAQSLGFKVLSPKALTLLAPLEIFWPVFQGEGSGLGHQTFNS